MNESILFFELVQVALGNRKALSHIPTEAEWEGLLEESRKQALVGICYNALQSLPAEQYPSAALVKGWTARTVKINMSNDKVSDACRKLTVQFEKNGFHCIILKGQANHRYYPSHLGKNRAPGDIDAWVFPIDESKKKVATVINFCQSMRKGKFVFYHNLDFPMLKTTMLEVHYRPTWLYCPWRNSRLQKWMDRHREYEEYDGYNVASLEFNIIFQLLHLYKHIFEEGIGLRQLIDYYFVLQNIGGEDAERLLCEVRQCLNRFGLKRFAGAVMYVLQEVCGLQEDKMIIAPNEKEGVVLLGEIMIGGNFGKYDERYNWSIDDDNENFNGFGYAYTKLKHNFRFFSSYPLEVLFEPLFRVYHWAWRTFRLWRWE